MFGLDGVMQEVRTLVGSFKADMDAMVKTLRETNSLLKEQNDLLRSQPTQNCSGSCSCGSSKRNASKRPRV